MIKEVMSLSERINDTSAAPWVIEEIRKLEQQRDALAALCQEGAAVLERTANDTLDGRNMAVRLREANTTSFARLKAQWQREALVRLRTRYCNENRSLFAIVDDEIEQLRRQAEGDLK